jgi:hypothetical protein
MLTATVSHLTLANDWPMISAVMKTSPTLIRSDETLTSDQKVGGSSPSRHATRSPARSAVVVEGARVDSLVISNQWVRDQCVATKH